MKPVALAVILLGMLRLVKPQVLMCASNPCQHGGECKDVLSKVNTYSCSCSAEWTGRDCEIDVDECTSIPCKNMGSCVNREEGFDCNCLPEWTGPTCERPSQCGQQLYTGWPSIQLQSISGPVFTPANFSDKILPYICSYTITNLDDAGKVELIFDDFLMYGSRNTLPCQGMLYRGNGVTIYDGQSAVPVLDQCFAANKRPRALASSSNSLRIDFKHFQSISYQFPVFRARYRFLASNEVAVKPLVDTINFFEDRNSQFSTILWQSVVHDVVWLFVAPKKKHVYLSLNPIYISKDADITLDIHDGVTSYTPKVFSQHYRYHFPALKFTSTSNGLYMRCRTSQLLGQNVTVVGVFVFFSEVERGELCSDFWCANNRCISSNFECDRVNHCGDNSDEKPCLGLCPDNWCANGGECHQVTAGFPRCTCKEHFSGDRCLEEEVCPKDYCMNGGTCLGSSVSMRYCRCLRPYAGPRCQQDKSGCPQHYCQNGGSCEGTHDRYHCMCPPDYKGMYCEMQIVETYEDDSFHNSLTYTLITVIPGALLLLAVWICCRMRRYRNPLYTRRSPEAFSQRQPDSIIISTDHPSSVSRSLSRLSSGSTYADEPPAYHVVVRNHRRKLRRHHTHPGTTHACSEEPPPSYESVVVALNGGQQTDPPPYIRVLQSRGRSLELEHQGSSAEAASDGSQEQGQGSSEGQQTVNRERGRESGSSQERDSLLSEGEPSECIVSHSV